MRKEKRIRGAGGFTKVNIERDDGVEKIVIENIKSIISSKGLKHYWVAQQMGLSKDQLSFIFQGRKKITCDHIIQFCEALEVTPNDLFMGGEANA